MEYDVQSRKVFLESKNGILDPQDIISRMPESVLLHMMFYFPYPDKDRISFFIKIVESRLSGAQREVQPVLSAEETEFMIWHRSTRTPVLPSLSHETYHHSDSEHILSQLSEEEQKAAEESFSAFLRPVDLYDLLQRRASRNPSFLSRSLHYKLQDKHKRRVQLSVSISRPLDDGQQRLYIFPLYILLARPVPPPNGEMLQSCCYDFNRACKLTGVQTVGSPQARFILPDINKLSTEFKSGSLVILLVHSGVEIDLTEDHMVSPANAGYCLMGKIPIDFIHFSRENSPQIGLGERAEFMSTISLNTCYMKLNCSNGKKCLSFQFPHNYEAEKVPVTVTAEELGAKDKLLHALRPRTRDVIFNYKYYNNMLQKTEVTEDYSCPFCLLKCASYKGLKCHLPASHDLFHYEFLGDGDYQVVNVYAKITAPSAEIVGKVIDRNRREKVFYFCHTSMRRKSKRRNQIGIHAGPLVLDSNKPGVSKRICRKLNGRTAAGVSSAAVAADDDDDIFPGPGSATPSPSPSAAETSRSEQASTEEDGEDDLATISSGPESTSQSVPGSSNAPTTLQQLARSGNTPNEGYDARNQDPLQARPFIHSRTAQPMTLEEVYADKDSEDEVDDGIADLEDKRMLDEFIDVEQHEKRLMHLWNSFKRKQRVLADGHIPWACEGFSTQHGQELVLNSQLLMCWTLFMVKLWDHGLLDAEMMNTCHSILDNYKDQNRANPVLDLAPAFVQGPGRGQIASPSNVHSHTLCYRDQNPENEN